MGLVSGAGTSYEGAKASALNADWKLFGTDPRDDWWREGTAIANRSWQLWRNDPRARAMVLTVVDGSIGPAGLGPRSLYQVDDQASTTDAERAQRRAIESSLRAAYRGFRFDAGGQLSRREMSIVMLTTMIVAGDAFATRCWKPGRPGRQVQATCWRMIDPNRVSNPNWSPNTDRRYEGLELNEDGVPIGLWVQRKYPETMQFPDWTWDYIPWYDSEGNRNVVHLKTAARADEMRGVGWFAPIMGLVKQLNQVEDAFVVSKRLQASMGLIVECDDPIAAAANDKNGAVLSLDNMGRAQTSKLTPGKVYYVLKGTKWQVLQFTYQGQEYKDFTDALLRSFTASWGLSSDFVMQQLTKGSLASARAALMQCYKMFHGVQETMIDHVEQPWAESVIIEDIARGKIVIPSGIELDRVLSLRFNRPPRAFPDPVREATAATMWADLGISPSTIAAQQGVDFEQEVMQSHSDRAFLVEQGVPYNIAAAPPVPGNQGGAPQSADGQPVPVQLGDDGELATAGKADGSATDQDDQP